MVYLYQIIDYNDIKFHYKKCRISKRRKEENKWLSGIPGMDVKRFLQDAKIAMSIAGTASLEKTAVQ